MSFAQEIRDFLGASQSVIKTFSDQSHKLAQDKYTNAKTDETIKEMNDPLNQKIKEATLAQKLASASLARGRLSLEQQAAALAAKPIQRPTGPGDVVQKKDGDDEEAVEPAFSTGAPNKKADKPVVQNWAKGGLVRKFAEGGAVEEEDLAAPVAPALPTMSQPIGSATIGRPTPQPSPVAQPGPAIGGTAGAEGATAENYEFGARSRKPSAAAVAAATEVEPPTENAIAESAKYGVQVIGGGEAVNTTVGRMKLEQYMRGAGAAPVNEMHEIYKKIDPTGKKYSESERNLIAFNTLYNFKLNSSGSEGPEAARKVGAAMLQHHRTAYERYKAIAAAALEGGNLDVATKAAMKAYANILDKKDLKLWVGEGDKIGYTYTGPDGKPISKGIMSPSELGAVITGQNAKSYDQWLLSAAGAAQQEITGEKKAAVGKGKKTNEGGTDELTTSEYKALKDRSDSHVDTWNTEQQKTKDGKAGITLAPKELAATKNMLYHVMANNPGTEDEGLRRLNTYIRSPVPKEGEKMPFNTVEDKENKMRIINFHDGYSMRIPENEYRGTFRVARGEYLDSLDKPKPPPEKSYTEMAVDTGKDGLEGVKGMAGRVWGPTINAARDEGVTGVAKDLVDLPTRIGTEAYGVPISAGKKAIGALYEAAAGAPATVREALDTVSEWAKTHDPKSSKNKKTPEPLPQEDVP